MICGDDAVTVVFNYVNGTTMWWQNAEEMLVIAVYSNILEIVKF